MKKFLKVVGVILMVFVLLGYFGSSNNMEFGRKVDEIFDTRFWFGGKDWADFYSGFYVCGVDIEPGNYDVQIRGGADYGRVEVYESYGVYKSRGSYFNYITIDHGDKGFHFSIRDGECIEVEIANVNGMRIRKV